MRFLSVFSGIGGIDLGLERAGWTVAGQIEVDPYCRQVLRRHWPEVWQWGDVRLLEAEVVREHCGRIDAIVGGVPCQPASVAGQRRGSADRRWLWDEFLRLVRDLGPRIVLAENVLGLVTLEPRGLDWICDELEAAGYATCPVIVGARHVGAPHRRDRVWIIARRVGESAGSGCAQGNGPKGEARGDTESRGSDAGVGHADGAGLEGWGLCRGERADERAARAAGGAAGVADGEGAGCEGIGSGGLFDGERATRGDDAHGRHRWPARPGAAQHEWEAPRVLERRMGRAAYGISRRLVLKALGNSVVPQVAEALGRAILAADRAAP